MIRWLIIVPVALIPLFAYQNCSKFEMLSYEHMDSSHGESRDPFFEHPSSKVVALQSAVQLSAPLRASTQAISYEWQRRLIGTTDFVVVPNGTSATLDLPSFGFGDQGDYKLVVTTESGQIESRLASIKIQDQTNSCLQSDLPKFQQPLGTYSNYAITNYFDLDPVESMLRDFMNMTGLDALTYDGHKGIDISLANFKYQDQGVNVLAMAEGIVELAVDGNPDRNVALDPNAQANYVVVRSPNGYSTGYLHLRRNSVQVTVGQRVTAGTVLGQVGSSGFSDLPHLHIETRDCRGASIDLMASSQMAEPYDYSGALRLMDFHARTAAINNLQQAIQVTGNSLTQSTAGQRIYFTYSLANARRGEVYRIDFVNPSGAVGFSFPMGTVSGKRMFGSYTFYGNFFIDLRGTWRIRLYRNNDLIDNRPWTVI